MKTSVWGKESLASAPLMSLGSDSEAKRHNLTFTPKSRHVHSHNININKKKNVNIWILQVLDTFTFYTQMDRKEDDYTGINLMSRKMLFLVHRARSTAQGKSRHNYFEYTHGYCTQKNEKALGILPIYLTVLGDKTLKKRGFSFLFGAFTLVGMYSKRVLDTVVKSSWAMRQSTVK